MSKQQPTSWLSSPLPGTSWDSAASLEFPRFDRHLWFAVIGGDDPKLREALTRAIPLRRLAQPADRANMVAFFASDEAAYITGQTVSVSGGLTMS